MTLSLRPALPSDLDLLAGMNKRLIEDERSRNPMDLTALRERLAGWLETGEYAVDLFLSRTHVVGYAVYQTRSADSSTGQCYVYLRQLYIERGERGKGLGTQALRSLIDTRFPHGCPVQLEVLAGNPGVQRFYERAGFAPYAKTMVWQPDDL
jgi:GNAT superfamily N-acetyltransferase